MQECGVMTTWVTADAISEARATRDQDGVPIYSSIRMYTNGNPGGPHRMAADNGKLKAKGSCAARPKSSAKMVHKYTIY